MGAPGLVNPEAVRLIREAALAGVSLKVIAAAAKLPVQAAKMILQEGVGATWDGPGPIKVSAKHVPYELFGVITKLLRAPDNTAHLVPEGRRVFDEPLLTTWVEGDNPKK